MTQFAALSLLSLLMLSQTAAAEDLAFGGNIAITSDNLSDGLSESDNRPALLFDAEIGKNGFYAGMSAAQVKDDSGNHAALDLSVGYRAELASSLEYDIGVTQSIRNKTGKDGTEVYGALSYPVSDDLQLTAETSYDLNEKTFGGNLSAEYALADAWTVSATAGRTDPDSSPFWGVGVSYDITELTSVALDYQDTSSTSGLLALTLNYKFGQGGE